MCHSIFSQVTHNSCFKDIVLIADTINRQQSDFNMGREISSV